MNSPFSPNSGRSVPSKQKKAKLCLDRVIGATIFHNGSFDINRKSGEIAYPAGCVTVTWNPESQQQTRFLSALPRDSEKLKPITSTAYSPDGRRLACAESGHSPSIFIWDLENRNLLYELKSHTLGVASMCFSQDGKYLISVGSEHDQQLNIWDFKSPAPLRGCKITSKVHAIATSEDGNSFVTVGLRHFRIWTMDLVGHSVTCGSFKDHEFVDVLFGRNSNSEIIYAVSREGVLFLVDAKSRQLSLHLDLHTMASALTLQNDRLIVACAKGIVRILDGSSLEYIATLPKPTPIGKEVVTSQEDRIKPSSSLHDSGSSNIYPDAVAVKACPNGKHVTVFYNNRALFVWDINDSKMFGKYRSFISHSSCIWGLDVFPAKKNEDSASDIVPSHSFASCSADGSIRIWNVESGGKNIFCKELVASHCLSSADEVYRGLVSAGPVDGLGGSLVGSSSATMGLSGGVRSIRISPCGNEIASGDRSGNVRVHSVADFSLVCLQEAHESEVLCLAYTCAQLNQEPPQLMLASGSRDRLIHVFAKPEDDSSVSKAFRLAKVSGVEGKGYKLVSTIEDHSASITGLAFSESGKQLFSTSADKSVIFRQISSGGQSLKRYHNSIMHGAMLDVKPVPFKPWIVSAGQDKKIYIHDVKTGAVVRTIPTLADTDTLKIELDSSGLLLATASQDRILRLYNFTTGELLASMAGHAEILTSVKFNLSGTSLISASGDGCIFIWTIAPDLVTAARSRLKQQRSKVSLDISTSPTSLHSSPSSSAPNSAKSSRKAPLPSPPTSGKRLSSAGNKLLERLISPAFQPNWVHIDHEVTQKQRCTSTATQGGWNRKPASSFSISTSVQFTKEFGLLTLDPAIQKRSWRTQLLETEGTASTTRRVLSSSRRPSSGSPFTTNAQDASVYYESSSEEYESVGPAIRSSSSASSHEDDIQDPSDFFHDLSSSQASDFLHEQNFGNLDHVFVPTKTTIQGRKSISAKYFVRKPIIAPSSSESLEVQSPLDKNANMYASSEQDRKEQMAKEVERTKARLRELGITFGTSPAPKPPRAVSSIAPESSAMDAIFTPLSIPHSPPSPLHVISKSMGDLPELIVSNEQEIGDSIDTTSDYKSEKFEPEDPTLDEDMQEAEEYLIETEMPPRPAFLESLLSGFDRTVGLYKELKESRQQDDMVHQFRAVFAEMKSTLDILSSEDSVLSNMASNRTLELTGATTLECSEAAMLERYSELLVGMVRAKLEPT